MWIKINFTQTENHPQGSSNSSYHDNNLQECMCVCVCVYSGGVIRGERGYPTPEAKEAVKVTDRERCVCLLKTCRFQPHAAKV